MKRLTITIAILFLFISVQSQISDEDKLSGFEKNNQSQIGVSTATMTSAARLFKDPNDLTSVIMVIPKGSQVGVLAFDSTYYIVSFEGDEGFIYKKQAVVNENAVQAAAADEIRIEAKQFAEEPEQQPESRFSYLERKYGTSVASGIYEGKIWKGMNSEMIKDSWGRAERVNREINGNEVKEEWLYKNTWLYLENNTLMGWGHARK